jgi:ribosomal protein L7Ae-like RNA K-turn-binding protein
MMKEDMRFKERWQAISGLLGLAYKAGKIKTGMSGCYQSCVSKRSKLVIIADDLSAHSRRKIEHIISTNGIKAFSYGTKRQFGLLFNRNDTGLISIEDSDFVAGIEKVMT